MHDAVRALTAEGAPFGVAEVAARSGIHATTLYRRWQTLEGLLLDVAAEDLARSAPLQPTGDLRADLLHWGRALTADVARPGGLAFFTAIARAGRQPDATARSVEELLAPRLEQVTALLDAADARVLSAQDVVLLLVAPVYLAALLGLSATPGGSVDVEVLVDNVMAVRDHRMRDRPRTPSGTLA